MWIIDILVLAVLIFVFKRTGNKYNSNGFFWIIYAIIGYILGFLIQIVYAITLQDTIEYKWGKDWGTGLFIVATIVIELITGFIFLALLKYIYSRKNNSTSHNKV